MKKTKTINRVNDILSLPVIGGEMKMSTTTTFEKNPYYENLLRVLDSFGKYQIISIETLLIKTQMKLYKYRIEKCKAYGFPLIKNYEQFLKDNPPIKMKDKIDIDPIMLKRMNDALTLTDEKQLFDKIRVDIGVDTEKQYNVFRTHVPSEAHWESFIKEIKKVKESQISPLMAEDPIMVGVIYLPSPMAQELQLNMYKEGIKYFYISHWGSDISKKTISILNSLKDGKKNN